LVVRPVNLACMFTFICFLAIPAKSLTRPAAFAACWRAIVRPDLAFNRIPSYAPLLSHASVIGRQLT